MSALDKVQEAFRAHAELAAPPEKPRLEALYRDAHRTWRSATGARPELHALVMELLFRRTEVTVDEDLRLRGLHGIGRAQ